LFKNCYLDHIHVNNEWYLKDHVRELPYEFCSAQYFNKSMAMAKQTLQLQINNNNNNSISSDKLQQFKQKEKQQRGLLNKIRRPYETIILNCTCNFESDDELSKQMKLTVINPQSILCEQVERVVSINTSALYYVIHTTYGCTTISQQ